MMLGKASGGAVRLSCLSELLIITEGIENALSVLHAQPNATVWAALSASGIRNLCLPDTAIVKTIIIAADHDSTGIKAAIQSAELWASTGRTVKIALLPKDFDFNDVLMGVAS
jgi:DNA primase